MSDSPGRLKTWLIAVRPFAFPAPVVPVLYGTVLAVVLGGAGFHLPLFVLTLCAMLSLAAGTNILSDIHDYLQGLDRKPTPVSGAVVRGLLTRGRALRGSVICIIIGCILGAFIIIRTGWQLLAIAAAGIAMGVFYTQPPLSLKYRGLGDLAVFLAYGVLATCGAWTVQTGQLTAVPLVWSLPISLLVVAIVHANNWRDLKTDRERGVRTFAGILGERGSKTYYVSLIAGAFGVTALLVLVTGVLRLWKPRAPLTVFMALLLFPMAVRLIRGVSIEARAADPHALLLLDARTARLHLLFGVTLTASLLLDLLLDALGLS
jgi:1,4-dihydroxy-2-naphthoate octaprenyltransferase